jgi:phosphate transport system substrate-binding protein
MKTPTSIPPIIEDRTEAITDPRIARRLKTWRTIGRAGLFAAALVICTSSAASTETLRIGGMGSAMAALPGVFTAFDPSQEDKLEVIHSLGSSGALRAVAEGVLDIAVSGRALTRDEIAQGLTQAAEIRTPFVLVTSQPRPNGFKSSEVAEIFKSRRPAWADGSLIRIIVRPKSDSDTTVLGGMFPGMAAAIEEVRRRPEIPMAATDQDNADMAERIPGSLTAATLSQVKMERRNLRFVAIDGVEPSLDHLESGTYPFAKAIYFVLPAKRKPLAERFVAFLGSPAGRAALRATGNLPAAD